MLAKKIALGFGIAIVFPAMIHSGVNVFSPPPPRWAWTPSEAQEDRKILQEKEVKRKAAQKEYDKHLFAVAVPLGLVAIVTGAFILSPGIGTGLMFGGIIAVFDGYFNYWSELPHVLRFTSLVVAFILLLVIGYWKLEGRTSPP